MRRLLILGGTRDAVALAQELQNRWGEAVGVTTSLAGRTRDPVRPAGAVRVGGFGGVAGLMSYLAEHRVVAVIDATHPFAAQMSRHASEACTAAGVPLLRMERPPWRPQSGDDWRPVDSNEAAAQLLRNLGRNVFLTIGATELQAYFGLPRQRFLVRAIEPDALPDLPAGWTAIFARGPFQETAELALMRRHRIEVLVTKNSGGSSVAAKLQAARALGIPVVMIDRPPGPDVDRVTTVPAASKWVERLLETV